jgi:4-oxalocrotonate tautomerase
MSKKLTRRGFMVKSALALGSVVAFELPGDFGAESITGFEALASETTSATIGEEAMPHVSVKLWPGRSEEEKKQLAEAITEAVVRFTGANESSVSVAIEDVSSEDWKEKVYDPEIRGKAEYLYKKPGYSM